MSRLLQGKVALVTGAGSGIGRASAMEFVKEGACVVVADVNAPGGEETVRLIKDAGGEALFVRTDISKPAEVEALVAGAVERFGRIDCAHNCAGIAGDRAPVVELSDENWNRTVATNLTGTWLCMKNEIRQMLNQGSGAIVNTSAANALTGGKGTAAYSACASGILGFTRSSALDYVEAGIRINAICPGIVDTPMIRRMIASNPQVEAQFVARVPMRRLGTPEEIARAVVWLCSDGASFITGQTIVADGGMVMR